MIISCSSDDGRPAADEPNNTEPTPHGFKTRHHTWTPAPEVARHLPRNFGIKYTTIEDGLRRRVIPAPLFLQEWALAGDAILRSRGLLAQAGGCYDFMRLIATLSVHLRERIQPRRFSSNDLYCKQFANGILPDDFVFQPPDAKWPAKSMLEEGRCAAKADAIPQPTLHQEIMYGIDAEAQRNPVPVTSLSTNETSRLVRMALFDVGPADGPIAPELKDHVYRRLAQLVRRQQDLPEDAFNDWFHRNFDNVVHTIAKQNNAVGGTLDRKVVRSAVIELVFDSWGYLAQTIECFAHMLAESLTPRLAPEDREVFEALYYRSPQLGNLPLILVANVSIAKPAIGRLLLDPTNDTFWGQLLRVLHTHSEMIVRRRAADRSKKREKGQGQVDRRQLVFPVDLSDYNAVGEELVELRDLKCNCGTRTPSFRTEVEPSACSTDQLHFNCECMSCGRIQDLAAPIEQCEQLWARQQED